MMLEVTWLMGKNLFHKKQGSTSIECKRFESDMDQCTVINKFHEDAIRSTGGTIFLTTWNTRTRQYAEYLVMYT